MFSSVDASEYICDLWRNPDHLTKENLAKFEDVSLTCDADHECRPTNPVHTISSTCMVWHLSLVIMHHLESHMTQSCDNHNLLSLPVLPLLPLFLPLLPLFLPLFPFFLPLLPFFLPLLPLPSFLLLLLLPSSFFSPSAFLSPSSSFLLLPPFPSLSAPSCSFLPFLSSPLFLPPLDPQR